jgi:hypothetical protein
MKVALSLEVTDDARRALSASKRLASRDEVRAFVEGVVARLSESQDSDAVSPLAAPSRNRDTAPFTNPTLTKRLAELKAEGWTEDQLRSYERGWQQL